VQAISAKFKRFKKNKEKKVGSGCGSWNSKNHLLDYFVPAVIAATAEC